MTLSPIQLYATKTINMYEFGTKHHQIFYRMAIQDEALFVELAKSYNKIEYRLYLAEVRRKKIAQGLKVDKVVYLSKENIEKTPEGIVLDDLGLNNVCCRRHMLTHVDIE